MKSPTTFFLQHHSKMCNKENATVAELCNTASRKSQKSTILYVMKAPKHYIPQSVSHYFTSIC